MLRELGRAAWLFLPCCYRGSCREGSDTSEQRPPVVAAAVTCLDPGRLRYISLYWIVDTIIDINVAEIDELSRRDEGILFLLS